MYQLHSLSCICQSSGWYSRWNVWRREEAGRKDLRERGHHSTLKGRELWSKEGGKIDENRQGLSITEVCHLLIFVLKRGGSEVVNEGGSHDEAGGREGGEQWEKFSLHSPLSTQKTQKTVFFLIFNKRRWMQQQQTHKDKNETIISFFRSNRTQEHKHHSVYENSISMEGAITL